LIADIEETSIVLL